MFFQPLKSPKSLQTTSLRARTGLLLSKIPTPNYLLYTNCGAIPSLIPSTTPELNNPIQLALADMYHLKEILQEYVKSKSFEESKSAGNALTTYLGLPQTSITFLTTGVAGAEKVDGHPKDKRLMLKQKDTTLTITPSDYLEAIKAFRPTIFMTPTQSITSEGSKKKRERAVKVSREYVDDLLGAEEIFEGENPPHALVTVSVEESYKILSEIIYGKIEEFAHRISGYFFNLHSLTPKTRSAIFDQFYERYPEDVKLRVLEGEGNPMQVLENLLLNGVDLFEASYPFRLVEQGLCLDIQTTCPEEYKMEEIKGKDEIFEMLTQKRQPKTLNLADAKFRDDSSPLSENCDCPACTSINRAYIYHLLDCKEMNASILLTLHNLHVYDKFFAQLRKVQEGSSDQDSSNSEELLRYASWFVSTQ